MPNRSEQMSSGPNDTQLTASEQADVSALADGTLDQARRAGVEARVAASPALTAAFERERRIVVALQQARATERAPEQLRARIESTRPSRATRTRRRVAYGTSAAVALAAVVLLLVLALPSGTPGAPSVSDAAALAALGPVHAAPAPDPTNPHARLNRSVGDVYFPNWAAKFGWQAIGMRIDQLKGRQAVTVYYEWKAGKQIAYTIVGSPVLAQPKAQQSWLDGTALRTLRLDGRLVVTWQRSGHTCVLSGTGVTAAVLQTLAAWKVPADSH
jgi:anti-sigma factor RsiW